MLDKPHSKVQNIFYFTKNLQEISMNVKMNCLLTIT